MVNLPVYVLPIASCPLPHEETFGKLGIAACEVSVVLGRIDLSRFTLEVARLKKKDTKKYLPNLQKGKKWEKYGNDFLNILRDINQIDKKKKNRLEIWK